VSTRLILCDLDDTLVVERGAAQAAFLATCDIAREMHGLDPAALTESVRAEARRLWRAAPTIEYCREIGISSWEGLWARFAPGGGGLAELSAWAPAYRLEAWSRALAQHGVEDATLARQLAGEFGARRRSLQVPFADAEPALRQLRQEYRLAILTNGAPDLQREKLHLSGLAGYFEAVFVSGDLGFGKPDVRVFAAVIDRVGQRAAELVMVGDGLRRDVAGAQQAGIPGMWIDRDGGQSEPGVVPDARITLLTELREAVRKLDQQEACVA
jgi:putative hydrolase of the HAD superfamily